MLDYRELDVIIDIVTEKILEEITNANRSGNLEEILSKWGFSDLYKKEKYYDTEKDGKILLFGYSAIKEKELLGIIKYFGLDKDRFEFYLDYYDSKKFDFNKIRYDTKYRLIIFGPVPHSATSMGEHGGIISKLQKEEGYPRIEVLSSNNSLKITKSNFREVIGNLLLENYI